MENKINIAELLKDCPSGMELDCTLFEGLEFDDIIDNEYLPIRCRVKNPDGGYNVYNFTKYGCWLNTTFAKCVIFPKGKTTWKGFHRPFKDGDIVATRSGLQVFILQRMKSNNRGYCYMGYDFRSNSFFNADVWSFERLATEEEKQKLFDAIKAKGYKWNAETKTLEELITPKKFDITTLKPFDKVLVRDSDKHIWCASIFSNTWKNKYYCVGMWHNQCIPYEGNEHLLGTTNDCDEYYKTW